MNPTSLTDSNVQSVTAEQSDLYDRIQSFKLDDPEAELSFSQRLARENGWSLLYAYGAIEEYKKFVFLAVTAEHPVTPSDQIDQVWHLHLTYTRSYWDNFCAEILKQPLNHDPTLGGSDEDDKFKCWYEMTLESYEQFFGVEPSVGFWPKPEERFGSDVNFVRVNTGQNWILPHSLFGQSILVVILLLLTLVLGGFYLVSSQGSPNPKAVILMIGLWVLIGFGFIQFVRGVIENRSRPSIGFVVDGDFGGGCSADY